MPAPRSGSDSQQMHQHSPNPAEELVAEERRRLILEHARVVTLGATSDKFESHGLTLLGSVELAQEAFVADPPDWATSLFERRGVSLHAV